MSRNYTQIMTAIWLDGDFRALTADAQWTYLMLVSQSDITSVGSLPVTIKRWVGYASGMSIKRLSIGIAELENHRFIVVDHAVEELLVRSFVRWDGGYKIPKRLEAIKATAVRLNSKLLQQVAAHELAALGIKHGIPTEGIDTLSNAYREDTDSSGVVVTNLGTTPNPQPTTHNQGSGAYPTATEKGTRISSDWRPSARLIEWVKSECPAVNGRTETDQFRDYWISKAGRDGLKVDWDATYRTWMRKAQTDHRPSRPMQSTTDARVGAAIDLANRLQAQENAQAAAQPRLEIAR